MVSYGAATIRSRSVLGLSVLLPLLETLETLHYVIDDYYNVLLNLN